MISDCNSPTPPQPGRRREPAAAFSIIAGVGLGICLGIWLSIWLGVAASPAEARGSFRLQQPWSSEHVARLPEPVRAQVASVCRGGIAQHGFAGYYPDRIVLHYEHLQCADRPRQCGPSGCLHQVYSFEHGGWHLVKSYQGGD